MPVDGETMYPDGWFLGLDTHTMMANMTYLQHEHDRLSSNLLLPWWIMASCLLVCPRESMTLSIKMPWMGMGWAYYKTLSCSFLLVLKTILPWPMLSTNCLAAANIALEPPEDILLFYGIIQNIRVG
jgi:hypothetical protein